MTNKPSNRIVLFLIAAPSVAFLLYAAAWAGSAYTLKGQAELWITAQQQAGRTITHGGIRISGFPGRAEITFPDWIMSEAATESAWTWRTGSLRLWTQAWAPTRFTVDLAGEHALSGVWTPPGMATTVTAERADVQPTLSLDGRITEVSIAVRKLAVAATDTAPLAAIEIGDFALTQIDATKSDDPPIWRLNVDVKNAGVSEMANVGVLAPVIQTARLTIDLVGQVSSGPLPNALAAWRAGGGTLELRELLLDWPPLSVSGTGTLALDENLQPIGALTAKFRGFFETVDAMTAQGLVRSSDASMARIVLGVMSRSPEGGGPPELNLAVTAQNQKLYTGPLSLMGLPTVTWPESVTLP